MNCKAAPGSAGKHGAGSKVPACHIPGTGTREARPRIHPHRWASAVPACALFVCQHATCRRQMTPGGFVVVVFLKLGVCREKPKYLSPLSPCTKGLGTPCGDQSWGGNEGMWVKEGGSPLPPFCPLALALVPRPLAPRCLSIDMFVSSTQPLPRSKTIGQKSKVIKIFHCPRKGAVNKRGAGEDVKRGGRRRGCFPPSEQRRRFAEGLPSSWWRQQPSSKPSPGSHRVPGAAGVSMPVSAATAARARCSRSGGQDGTRSTCNTSTGLPWPLFFFFFGRNQPLVSPKLSPAPGE